MSVKAKSGAMHEAALNRTLGRANDIVFYRVVHGWANGAPLQCDSLAKF